MTREEFIGKLQMCYFGDRNAFNEIVGVYDNLKEENQRLNNVLNELEKWLKDIIDNNNDRFELYKEDVLHNEYQINNIKYQNNILMAILEKLNELKESDK